MTNIAIILPEQIYGFKQEVLAASDCMGAHGREVFSTVVGGSIKTGDGYVSHHKVKDNEREEHRYSQFELDLIRMMAPLRLM